MDFSTYTLLLQAGYLTITKYDEKNPRYIPDYPNKKGKIITDVIFKRITGWKDVKNFIDVIRKRIEGNNIGKDDGSDKVGLGVELQIMVQGKRRQAYRDRGETDRRKLEQKQLSEK